MHAVKRDEMPRGSLVQAVAKRDRPVPASVANLPAARSLEALVSSISAWERSSKSLGCSLRKRWRSRSNCSA
jgi:hypothetical protein